MENLCLKADVPNRVELPVSGWKLVREILSQQQLQRGVEQLARRVTQYYGGKQLTILGVLTGSLVLLADEFVVGYGLDYRDAYRNLSFVAALEPRELIGDEPIGDEP